MPLPRVINDFCGPPGAMLVEVYARAHLGLLQLSDAYSTKNMGFGVSINRPRWQIAAREATEDTIVSRGAELAPELEIAVASFLGAARETTRLPGVALEIREDIPLHVGLGAKTALLNGVAAICVALLGNRGDYRVLRSLTRRGGTSGIGTNVAWSGGFLLDGGHHEPGPGFFGPSSARAGRPQPKPLFAMPLPPWPMLVVRPLHVPTISGEDERRIFAASTPLPRDECTEIAALVLYEVLPAVLDASLPRFARAVAAFQSLGLKRREWDAQNPLVHAIREVALAEGATCVALSSMGPSLVLFGSDSGRVARTLRTRFGDDSLRLELVRPRNRGLDIAPEPSSLAAARST